MNSFSGWISQNWFWFILLGFVVYFGWFIWPRLKPNPRRWVAGGLGLTFLTIILARLAGGALLDTALVLRAVLMGMAGLFLVLVAYFTHLQNSLLEYFGWSILIAASLVSLLFRSSALWVQGLVFVAAAGLAMLFQALAGNPASQWESPPKDKWM